MITENPARRAALGGLFLTLALALPPLFHLVGQGSVWLPMFLPVLVLGFLADWKTAVTVGVLAPMLSSLLTGMPPLMPPTAFMMMAELAVLGGLAALLYNRFDWGLWPALLTSIVATRLVGFLLKALLAELFHIPGVAYGLVMLVSGLPGVALQLVVVPLAVRRIERRFGRPFAAKAAGKREFFDYHADGWDEGNYNEEDLRRLDGLVQDLDLQPGWKVLDVGSGTGVLVQPLLGAVGSRGSVVGLDISPAMLAHARAKGFPANVRFMEGCAEAIPLPAAEFDVVVCFSVFPHFDHHPQALRELSRVLKPGGRLFILHLEGSGQLNAFHKGVGGAVAHDRLPDAGRMKRLLESCGYREVSVEDRPDLYLARARNNGAHK